MRWRKSSYSEANDNSNCVEVAPALDAVRDSKNLAVLEFSPAGVSALLRQVKAGRF